MNEDSGKELGRDDMFVAIVEDNDLKHICFYKIKYKSNTRNMIVCRSW